MSQIAVRLSGGELRALDEAVAQGPFPTRAEAVREGIRLLERQLREARIEASYRAAYKDARPSAEETRMLDAALALAGDALAGDAPA
jgi:Arc/MetJ-type ribon-helix-helix transcriptional regulator